MRLLLDRRSSSPLYRQIETLLRQAITEGGLPPETRLPATRKLARDLGVNRITVENAYAELEAEGLIAGRPGSGTYVVPRSELLPPPPPRDPATPWPLWQRELSDPPPVQEAGPSEHARDDQPSRIVSFADGLGDRRLFPVDELRRILQAVIRRDGAVALDYGEPAGHAGLRTTIARVLSSQGLVVRPDEVLITSGSQQALALVTALLLRSGDAVLVEQPTYRGALDLFRSRGLRLIGIPVDEQGMRVEELERLLLQHHPRLIYTIPNFQNPTGFCLATPRRRQLLALAIRHNIPILEDDFVGDLRYQGRAQPSLKASDPGGCVLYASTFSKMLMPGLRVGFVIAEGPVHRALVRTKRVHDLAGCNWIQRAVAEYVTIGRYQTHLRRSCRLYRVRRDAMLEAVRRYLPNEVQVELPHGGLFLWLRLPEGFSSGALSPLAYQAGVAIAPGTDFFLDATEGEPFLRLNFAAHAPEAIEEGMRRLGRAMQAIPRSRRKPGRRRRSSSPPRRAGPPEGKRRPAADR